jgi:hypothetical protein
MIVQLSMLAGAGAQFFDNNGSPLSGGKLYTYLAGTTTNAATYTTNAGNVAHANPIILDSAGRVPSGGEIWLTDATSYKFVVKTSNDTTIATYDNITGNSSGVFSTLAASSGSSLIGYTQGGGGAQATTVQAALRRVVWVEDFLPSNFNFSTDNAAPYIQAAIDQVTPGEVRFANPQYRISSPIYMDSGVNLVGKGAASTKILKTTSTVGSGSNVSRGGTITDSYAQNAIIILRHADNVYNEQSSIRGISLYANGYIVTYGIYAPRTSKLWLEDVYIYQCQTGFISYDSWLATFNKVIADSNSQKGINGGPTYGYAGTTVGIQWAPDGSGSGAGTSLSATDCWARDCDFGWYLYGLSYSSLNACAADNISNCAYWIQLSRISFNGCGHENVQIKTKAAIYCEYSTLTFNSCDNYLVYGAAAGTTAFIWVEGGAVVFNGCAFRDLTNPGATLNILIQAGGKVINNNSAFSTNGNSFKSLAGGGQYIGNDSIPPYIQSSDAGTLFRYTQGRIRDNEVKEKGSKSIVQAGTVIATFTAALVAGVEFAVCKFTVSYQDASFPSYCGITEFLVSVYQEAGTIFSQNVTVIASSTAGNTGGTVTAPSFTFSRASGVWSLTMAPAATFGDMIANTITAEMQNLQGVTLALP